mgnify:CR=1 FL=1
MKQIRKQLAALLLAGLLGRLAALQKWHRQELEKRGANVRVLYGLEEVQAFIREVFGA